MSLLNVSKSPGNGIPILSQFKAGNKKSQTNGMVSLLFPQFDETVNRRYIIFPASCVLISSVKRVICYQT